jgi:TPP-dependent pyruvate/acetoin dehydrogenase alpha subunit
LSDYQVHTLHPPAAGKWPTDARLFGKKTDSFDGILFRRMAMIRRFEEKLLALFDEGVLNGTTHCCIGQEADCVGVVNSLRLGDHIFSNHRCHGHFLAWTGDVLGLLAEIMGKQAGVCGGKGGSQHLCVPGFKSNGILGGITPNAAGVALAEKLRDTSNISVVFLGDGALGEGIVYETMNLASLWQLPLLFVVENNGWSQSTPLHLNFSGTFKGRFEAFNIRVNELESTDVREITRVAAQTVATGRRDRQPAALVLHTFRLCHHSKNDDSRPLEEVEKRRLLDPIRIQGERLPVAERDGILSDVNAALVEVTNRARELV